MDTENVYIRNESDSNELNIAFRYVNEKFNVDREFNFCRKPEELTQAVLARIQTNVHKELSKKLKKKLDQLPAEVNVNLYQEGSDASFNEITFAELLSSNVNGVKLKVLEHSFNMVVNPPWVKILQLPKCILAGCLVYPTKFEMQFGDRESSEGTWYRSKVPGSSQWELCGQGFRYDPKSEDIGYFMKFVVAPKNDKGMVGPLMESVSKSAVQAGPGACPFEARQKYTPTFLKSSDELRVMTYNLLADLYTDSDYTRTHLFPYCPPEYLQIDYRKQLFVKEITGYHADLICLQEVDQRIFDVDLQEVLTQPPNNFQGFLSQKGDCPEGVAIFYRTSRFELIQSHTLNLGKNIPTLDIFQSLWSKIKSNGQLAKRICDRTTTVQICLLKVKDSDHFVLVANTHLYFHPDADHIRLLQMCFSIIYVEHIRSEVLRDLNISNPNNVGLVFCGDFNSTPDCGIYKLMTEKVVDSSLDDWRSNSEEAVSGVEVSQPFEMSSACGTPPFTNFTTLFSGCLDYIYYQKDRFEVMQTVPLPSEAELRENTAIPSSVCPSDHVALIADLKIRPA
ncbi:hypothetical protein KR026_010129 [Drosophila bipectinata]|nr:hypothetical protein KR026_010129 [Drosophila bipectinata]